MALVKAIPEIVVTLTENLPQIVFAIIEGLARLPELIWNILTECIGKFISWGQESQTEGEEGSKGFLEKVGEFFMQLPGMIWGWLCDAANNVGTFFANLINTGVSKTSEFVYGVINFVKELPGRIWNGIVGAVSNVASWGGQLLSTGISAAQNLVNGIWNTICGLPGKMLDIGKNLVQGIWNGINNAKDWILGKIKEFGQGILNGIKSFFGIKSPSKLFEEQVGKNLALGLGEGFTASMKDVSKQMQGAIPTELDADLNLNMEAAQNSFLTAQKPAFPHPAGLYVHIENFVNNRSQDVQAFAQELEFYSRRNSLALG